MSKAKSVFVTVLVAVMLATIVVGAYLLEVIVWAWIVGALAVYGLASGAVKFCLWLQKEHDAEAITPLGFRE